MRKIKESKTGIVLASKEKKLYIVDGTYLSNSMVKRRSKNVGYYAKVKYILNYWKVTTRSIEFGVLRTRKPMRQKP